MENANEGIIQGSASSDKAPQGTIRSKAESLESPQLIVSAGGTPQIKPSKEPLVSGRNTKEALVSHSTAAGGLSVVPDDFNDKEGSWTTIVSENPFDNLYLDYKQNEAISDEMVKRNFEVLVPFWREKQILLNGVAREKMKAKYGESVINEAEKKLGLAYTKLKSPESRKLYAGQLDEQRVRPGIEAINLLLESTLFDGHLKEATANSVVLKGLEKGMHLHEIVDYVLKILQENNFKPRAKKDHPDPLKNQWMTDEAWRKIVVEWLGEYASTVEELGEITFRKKDMSEYFLRDKNFLPPLVNKLTDSASRTAEFQRILEEEEDTEKRYLKILYHLNPSLPFRFRDEEYDDVKQLLDAACQASASFWLVMELFTKGYLQIWLAETAPQVASLISDNNSSVDFLRFLYSVNRNYPFYLNTRKFASPEDLVSHLSGNQSNWASVSQSIENGYLSTWFAGIGRSGINTNYNRHLEKAINSGLYNDAELKLAAAQALILAIDPSFTEPIVSANVNAIRLLEIEVGGVARYLIRLRLINSAFVKMRVELDTKIEGITLSEKELVFNSYTGQIETEIYLTVDSIQLIKDKLYSLKFVTKSPYGITEIPIELKTVFPKKAYAVKLVQYGLIGAAYLGLLRYILGLLLNDQGWLSRKPYLISQSPLLSFLLFAFFVVSTIYFYRFVKKAEKI
ncbi:hypothetical protein DYBT9275_02826 [Dyadobacter sp. CECT 9275]|uniref:Uncharacterized protein n=1 Tax=Dyadobacter helix TaxID=2822344 RepID=A0A916NCI1_9BACT|nr:hypothetical protein [Dyadobacter sp. CECT 9275]CAG5002170.1 hypothetical protein DYBT9275_02826 [Dyadobacter sp. CECT 9275]